jgi:hypothetical protein
VLVIKENDLHLMATQLIILITRKIMLIDMSGYCLREYIFANFLEKQQAATSNNNTRSHIIGVCLRPV